MRYTMQIDWKASAGVQQAPDEERVSGSVHYLAILRYLHAILRPAHYLEIGVRYGKSLVLALGPATGVDPSPVLRFELPATTLMRAVTSDEFFADQDAVVAPELCFIDGLHLFEYALRDFINVERCAAPGAVVVFDDIFPNHPSQAERVRRTAAWTGDVWHIPATLARYRPDLFLLPLDASPTGMLLVAGLDPSNTALQANYQSIVQEALAVAQPPTSVLARDGAMNPSAAGFAEVVGILRNAREQRMPPGQMVAELRSVGHEVYA